MRNARCIALALLAGCGADGIDANRHASRSDSVESVDLSDQYGGIHATVMLEWLYDAAGVTVVLENGYGPEQIQMVEAAMTFRRAARQHYGLALDAEREVWRSIDQIRWTAEQVDQGGTYDGGTIRLQYSGCPLDAPLYRMLATHYNVWLGALGQDLTWADDLTALHHDAVCP